MSTIDRSGCTARRHGSQSAYNHYGCRCTGGKEAARLYRKRHRQNRQPAGLVDSTGARRRIQALMAMGWPKAEIGRRLGMSHPNSLSHVLGRDQVRRDTHESISALYEKLCMTSGPSALTRGKARALGYRTALAWNNIDLDPEPVTVEPDSDQVDPVAVVLAVAGDPPEVLRDVDRRAAVAELVRRGEATTQIAARIGITEKQADRDRDTVGARQRRNAETRTRTHAGL